MKRGFIFAIAVFVFVSYFSVAHGQQFHNGTISNNQIWLAANSPHYITGDVTVCGAVLGVEEGASVRFFDGTGLIVGGPGCAGASIVAGAPSANLATEFTAVSIQEPGDWKYIWIRSNADTANFYKTHIKYGGGSAFVPAAVVVSNDGTYFTEGSQIGYSERNGLLVFGGGIAVADTAGFYHNGQQGIFLNSNAVGSFSNISVFGNNSGIRVDDSFAEVDEAWIYQNNNYGAYALDSSTLHLEECWFNENDVGVRYQNSTGHFWKSISDGNWVGGVEIFNGSNVDIIDSGVGGNFGDGILVDNSVATLNGSTEPGNKSVLQANYVGLHVKNSGDVTVSNYHFYENHSLGGFLEDGKLVLNNCCFQENADGTPPFTYDGINFTAGLFVLDGDELTINQGNEFFDHILALVNLTNVDFFAEDTCWYAGKDPAINEAMIYHNTDSYLWTWPAGWSRWGQVTYYQPPTRNCYDSCQW